MKHFPIAGLVLAFTMSAPASAQHECFQMASNPNYGFSSGYEYRTEYCWLLRIGEPLDTGRCADGNQGLLISNVILVTTETAKDRDVAANFTNAVNDEHGTDGRNGRASGCFDTRAAADDEHRRMIEHHQQLYSVYLVRIPDPETD